MAAFPLQIPATSRPPKLVVFDLDKTLVACDSTLLWTDFLYEKKLVTDPIWRQIDRDMLKNYDKGDLDIREFYRKHCGAFVKIPTEKLDQFALEFARKKVAPLAFPDAKKWVKCTTQANIPMCVLSASATFLVKPIAKVLGIADAIGMDLEVVDGFYTGEILGIPSFQEGKVKRIEAKLAELGVAYEDVLFFTDSRNDLPLAEASGFACCVNPDAVLSAAARRNGWKVFKWELYLRTQLALEGKMPL